MTKRSLPKVTGPKTTLKGDVVACVFGPKTKSHVVLFANATQVELVSIYPRKKNASVTHCLDIRQKLTARDSEDFFVSLLHALDYDVVGHRRPRRGPNRFVKTIGDQHPAQLRLLVRPPLDGFFESMNAYIALYVSSRRAQSLANMLADTMGWDL